MKPVITANICPKCGTNMGHGNTQCYACGEIIRHPNFVPYKVRHYDKPIKLKIGCVNCGRQKKTVARDLCMGCYQSGMKLGRPGTPEYIKGLAIAKARYDNPEYLGTRGSYLRPRKGWRHESFR